MRRSSSYSVRSDRPMPQLVHQGASWSPCSSPNSSRIIPLACSPSFLTIPSPSRKRPTTINTKTATNCRCCCAESSPTANSSSIQQHQHASQTAEETTTTFDFPQSSTNRHQQYNRQQHSSSMSSASIQLMSSTLSPLMHMHQQHRSLPNQRYYCNESNHDNKTVAKNQVTTAAPAPAQQVSFRRRASSTQNHSAEEPQQVCIRKNRSAGSFKLSRQNRTNSSGGNGVFADNNKTTTITNEEESSQEWSHEVAIRQLASNAFSSLYYGSSEDIHVTARQAVILVQLLAIFNQQCSGNDVQKLCHEFMLPAANLLDDLKSLFSVASIDDDDVDEKNDRLVKKPNTQKTSLFPLCLDEWIAIQLADPFAQSSITTNSSSTSSVISHVIAPPVLQGYYSRSATNSPCMHPFAARRRAATAAAAQHKKQQQKPAAKPQVVHFLHPKPIIQLNGYESTEDLVGLSSDEEVYAEVADVAEDEHLPTANHQNRRQSTQSYVSRPAAAAEAAVYQPPKTAFDVARTKSLSKCCTLCFYACAASTTQQQQCATSSSSSATTTRSLDSGLGSFTMTLDESTTTTSSTSHDCASSSLTTPAVRPPPINTAPPHLGLTVVTQMGQIVKLTIPIFSSNTESTALQRDDPNETHSMASSKLDTQYNDEHDDVRRKIAARKNRRQLIMQHILRAHEENCCSRQQQMPATSADDDASSSSFRQRQQQQHKRMPYVLISRRCSTAAAAAAQLTTTKISDDADVAAANSQVPPIACSSINAAATKQQSNNAFLNVVATAAENVVEYAEINFHDLLDRLLPAEHERKVVHKFARQTLSSFKKATSMRRNSKLMVADDDGDTKHAVQHTTSPSILSSSFTDVVVVSPQCVMITGDVERQKNPVKTSSTNTNHEPETDATSPAIIAPPPARRNSQLATLDKRERLNILKKMAQARYEHDVLYHFPLTLSDLNAELVSSGAICYCGLDDNDELQHVPSSSVSDHHHVAANKQQLNINQQTNDTCYANSASSSSCNPILRMQSNIPTSTTTSPPLHYSPPVSSSKSTTTTTKQQQSERHLVCITAARLPDNCSAAHIAQYFVYIYQIARVISGDDASLTVVVSCLQQQQQQPPNDSVLLKRKSISSIDGDRSQRNGSSVKPVLQVGSMDSEYAAGSTIATIPPTASADSQGNTATESSAHVSSFSCATASTDDCTTKPSPLNVAKIFNLFYDALTLLADARDGIVQQLTFLCANIDHLTSLLHLVHNMHNNNNSDVINNNPAGVNANVAAFHQQQHSNGQQQQYKSPTGMHNSSSSSLSNMTMKKQHVTTTTVTTTTNDHRAAVASSSSNDNNRSPITNIVKQVTVLPFTPLTDNNIFTLSSPTTKNSGDPPLKSDTVLRDLSKRFNFNVQQLPYEAGGPLLAEPRRYVHNEWCEIRHASDELLSTLRRIAQNIIEQSQRLTQTDSGQWSTSSSSSSSNMPPILLSLLNTNSSTTATNKNHLQQSQNATTAALAMVARQQRAYQAIADALMDEPAHQLTSDQQCSLLARLCNNSNNHALDVHVSFDAIRRELCQILSTLAERIASTNGVRRFLTQLECVLTHLVELDELTSLQNNSTLRSSFATLSNSVPDNVEEHCESAKDCKTLSLERISIFAKVLQSQVDLHITQIEELRLQISLPATSPVSASFDAHRRLLPNAVMLKQFDAHMLDWCQQARQCVQNLQTQLCAALAQREQREQLQQQSLAMWQLILNNNTGNTLPLFSAIEGTSSKLREAQEEQNELAPLSPKSSFTASPLLGRYTRAVQVHKAHRFAQLIPRVTRIKTKRLAFNFGGANPSSVDDNWSNIVETRKLEDIFAPPLKEKLSSSSRMCQSLAVDNTANNTSAVLKPGISAPVLTTFVDQTNNQQQLLNGNQSQYLGLIQRSASRISAAVPPSSSATSTTTTTIVVQPPQQNPSSAAAAAAAAAMYRASKEKNVRRHDSSVSSTSFCTQISSASSSNKSFESCCSSALSSTSIGGWRGPSSTSSSSGLLAVVANQHKITVSAAAATTCSGSSASGDSSDTGIDTTTHLSSSDDIISNPSSKINLKGKKSPTDVNSASSLLVATTTSAIYSEPTAAVTTKPNNGPNSHKMKRSVTWQAYDAQAAVAAVAAAAVAAASPKTTATNTNQQNPANFQPTYTNKQLQPLPPTPLLLPEPVLNRSTSSYGGLTTAASSSLHSHPTIAEVAEQQPPQNLPNMGRSQSFREQTSTNEFSQHSAYNNNTRQHRSGLFPPSSAATTNSSSAASSSSNSSCAATQTVCPATAKLSKGPPLQHRGGSLRLGNLPSSNSHLWLCDQAPPPLEITHPHLFSNYSHLPHHSSHQHIQQQTAATITTLKRQRTLGMILTELLQTERDYIEALEFVITTYLPEMNRHDLPQPLRGHAHTIFGNLEKIYSFHKHFFLDALETCCAAPLKVGACFLEHEQFFHLYALYNKNKPKSDKLMNEYGHRFFRFKQLQVQDAFDLSSYLLKPVQRMGKYDLLLRQMLKECPPTASIEWQTLVAAEEMVRFQLRHGNDLLAMDSLVDCDANLSEQGRLIRQDEMLFWRGNSKYAMRNKGSTRRVFLFEHMIVVTKPKRTRDGTDVFQYKFSLKMSDIGLTENPATPKKQATASAAITGSTTFMLAAAAAGGAAAAVGLSSSATTSAATATAASVQQQRRFEIWFRKRKSQETYTLQSHTVDVKLVWTREISALLWQQALHSRASRMAELSSMGFGHKPLFDLKPTFDSVMLSGNDVAGNSARNYSRYYSAGGQFQQQNQQPWSNSLQQHSPMIAGLPLNRAHRLRHTVGPLTPSITISHSRLSNGSIEMLPLHENAHHHETNSNFHSVILDDEEADDDETAGGAASEHANRDADDGTSVVDDDDDDARSSVTMLLTRNHINNHRLLAAAGSGATVRSSETLHNSDGCCTHLLTGGTFNNVQQQTHERPQHNMLVAPVVAADTCRLSRSISLCSAHFHRGVTGTDSTTTNSNFSHSFVNNTNNIVGEPTVVNGSNSVHTSSSSALSSHYQQHRQGYGATSGGRDAAVYLNRSCSSASAFH